MENAIQGEKLIYLCPLVNQEIKIYPVVTSKYIHFTKFEFLLWGGDNLDSCDKKIVRREVSEVIVAAAPLLTSCFCCCAVSVVMTTNLPGVIVCRTYNIFHRITNLYPHICSVCPTFHCLPFIITGQRVWPTSVVMMRVTSAQINLN